MNMKRIRNTYCEYYANPSRLTCIYRELDKQITNSFKDIFLRGVQLVAGLVGRQGLLRGLQGCEDLTWNEGNNKVN